MFEVRRGVCEKLGKWVYFFKQDSNINLNLCVFISIIIDLDNHLHSSLMINIP